MTPGYFAYGATFSTFLRYGLAAPRHDRLAVLAAMIGPRSSLTCPTNCGRGADAKMIGNLCRRHTGFVHAADLFWVWTFEGLGAGFFACGHDVVSCALAFLSR